MAFLPALAAVAPALGVLGAATSAVGTIMGGEATAQAAAYNAEIARNNAKIANQNATYSIQAGQAKAETQGLQEAEQGGAVKTALAANGVDVNSGSALDVEKGQREKGALDVDTVMNNAELQAWGYKTQQASFLDQAALDTMEAQEAPLGADLSAGGGLLSSVSSLGMKWNPFTMGSTPDASSGSGAIYTPMGPTGFGVGGV